MMKRGKLLHICGIFLIIALLWIFPGRKWARKHVDFITATTDHPLGCASCHLYIQKDNFISKIVNAEYCSPINMAVSGKGDRLYVVAQEKNALMLVDLAENKVIKSIRTGNHPYNVVLDEKGNRCYISNQWSDYVLVTDLELAKITDTLTTGNGPAGLQLSADNRYLFAVNSFSNDISVIDLQQGYEIKRLEAGNNPIGIQLSPGGKIICVTSRRGLIAPYGSPLMTELTVVNSLTQRVTEHKNIESAYLMENIAFTPSGDLAITALIRPKNLVPSIQVERGWMMTNGIGIIEQKPGGRTIQLLLDEPNAYYADGYDVVITPDGKKTFISSSGTDCISVVDMDSVRAIIAGTSDEMLQTYSNHLGISSRFVIKRIPTGANPKGLALSPDGKKLYVAEQLEDKISVISTESLKVLNKIDLGGPRRITVARWGRRLLNNSGHTFQKQYSCYTCHPDAHEDGLVYNMASKDMGRNLTNTQSLRNISDTPPFKWNGKNQTVYKQDGIRFSTVLTRTEAFNYNELDAISAYIMSGIPNPPNLHYNPSGELTSAQLRGKTIFERAQDNRGFEIPVINRCVICHPAPYYTNKRPADVGTLAASDDSILFDTPHLNNIFASPPYLHDGRAATLEEIWTLYGKTEQHGAVNDLTKIQLNDLVEYLKSLRDPTYEPKGNKTVKASVANN